MAAKFETRDRAAAVKPLKETGEAAGIRAAPEAAPTNQDWRQREQFRLKVIEARVKLKLMRDRTDALKEALERYRTRSGSTRA